MTTEEPKTCGLVLAGGLVMRFMILLVAQT